MSVHLALQDHLPRSARVGVRRWLYVGDDPCFELPGRERVASADAIAAAAARLREPYLDAIGRLSLENASPVWWATHLAAKHPYPSLFARLCGLAVALEPAACADSAASDATMIVCSTPAQLQELARAVPGARPVAAGLARARRALPELALRAGWPSLRWLGEHGAGPVRGRIAAATPGLRFALERTAGHRRRSLEALGARRLEPLSGKGTAMLVTWVDERSFDRKGGFRDPHLGPLGDLLRDQGLRVARLAKPLLHAPFAACSRGLLATGEPIAFPDLYLSAEDWRSCERRVADWRAAIPEDLDVAGVPFARLAREYVDEHRRAQVDALSHEVLVRNLAGSGVAPGLVVLPWEGHAWEQVLIDAVHRHMPGTRVVGYDNLNFSSLALSLFPSRLELDVRPLPDRVVSNGPTFANVLKASAFPDERVRVGCALRHTHLEGVPEPRSRRVGERQEPGFVLGAGSIDAAQTIEMLRKAQAAFGEELVARLHPASDARAIRAALPHVRMAEEPLGALLPSADAMLYTYSSVPYEALAARTPPVFVRSEVMLDLDQLEPTPDVRWVARTVEELRAVVTEIRALRDRPGWERRARDVLGAALAPVGPDCVELFL